MTSNGVGLAGSMTHCFGAVLPDIHETLAAFAVLHSIRSSTETLIATLRTFIFPSFQRELYLHCRPPIDAWCGGHRRIMRTGRVLYPRLVPVPREYITVTRFIDAATSVWVLRWARAHLRTRRQTTSNCSSVANTHRQRGSRNCVGSDMLSKKARRLQSDNLHRECR